MRTLIPPNSRGKGDRAYSFTDLIATVGVIILLAALGLPAAANSRTKGQGASCLTTTTVNSLTPGSCMRKTTATDWWATWMEAVLWFWQTVTRHGS